MCYNCGCGIPDDSMGHPDNITNDTFRALAGKKGVSDAEVKKQMDVYIKENKHDDADFESVFQKASQAWGQSIEDARKETLKLLEK